MLVLGVYHMASSGNHVVESHADDILSPRRQAELAELLVVLERFRPTRIAVEVAFHDDDVLSGRYAAYLNGDRELTRNETEQIGFRLAKQLGHTSVYPVDADGEYPYPRLQDYAQARGHGRQLESWTEAARKGAEAWSAYLASHTLLEALLFMNDDHYAAALLAADYGLAHLGDPWNWAGPDLVSDWFRRNIRIYSNILDLVESPEERILVIFGAGHLGWLRHNFATDPKVRLRQLADLIP
ncbi:MAG TPA: DUF5694 domain-containing protein [Longimicrobiales bacterium]|nr:DUF5694 domain-containing protein [Longimicrobiales bacterium]